MVYRSGGEDREEEGEEEDSRPVADAIPTGQLSFAFIDVYSSPERYFHAAAAWFDSLRRGGVLMGTRLGDALSLDDCSPYLSIQRERVEGEVHRPRQWVDTQPARCAAFGVRTAVDTLSWRRHTAYLATFNERRWHDSRLLDELDGGLPAWYLHKLL